MLRKDNSQEPKSRNATTKMKQGKDKPTNDENQSSFSIPHWDQPNAKKKPVIKY